MTSLGVEALSAREAQVLDALGEHLTNAEIAQQLHISVRTVESHVSSLLRKLGAADRRELASVAGELAAPEPQTGGEVTGLPGTWTSFIGRSAELDEISAALATNRLVTLVGPGGIGKTRLASVAATQGAGRFPNGGAFVNLVPARADFLVQAVAAALGVAERAQESLDSVVHDRLRGGRGLLVLDNCEHVLGAAARFVESLLTECPDVVVLATSRERLGVVGERVVLVPPLGLEAEQLFVDRAASADADPALVADICRRLDGMPLAIELAAARSASLGIDGLLAGLDDHLRLLSRSSPGDRHGSLRGVIGWSHDLLDEDERVLFRRLAPFAGAFDLAAASTVAAGGDVAMASDVIGRLTDKSLLVHGTSATGSRWRMLETVHAFAREQLDASGEAEEQGRRHLVWATGIATEIERAVEAGEPWRDRFDAVADDLRAALVATPPAVSADGTDFTLAMALGHLAYARRFLMEARQHYESASTRAGDAAATVAALRMAGAVAYAEMRGEVAFELLTRASDLAEQAGDRNVAAITLAQAECIAGRAPATFVKFLQHDALTALVDRVRSLAPGDGLEVRAHIALAVAWDGARGPCTPAPGAGEAALALARELDDPVLISSALDAVGSSATYEGRFKDGSALVRERLALLDRLDRHDPRSGSEATDIFHMASESAVAAGELDDAVEAARLSIDDVRGHGVPHFAATHMVVPLVLQGSFADALTQAQVMRDGWVRSDRPTAGWMAPAFYAAAMVRGVRGEPEEYEQWWELGAFICRQTRVNSFGLFVQPRVLLHQGQIEEAMRRAYVPGQETAGAYHLYAHAMSVEVAIMAEAPDAAARLAVVAPMAAENDFVAALLARATGRLHDDEAEIRRAVVLWEGVGARFERATTLLLLPDRAAEGRAELDALGCPAPPA